MHKEEKTDTLSQKDINMPLPVTALTGKVEAQNPQIVGWALEKGMENVLPETGILYVNTLKNAENTLYAHVQEKSVLKSDVSVKGSDVPEI